MAHNYPSDTEALRAEIAAAAARMIAEDGADYGTAKRKAAKQILGEARVRGDILPDNTQIEEEVKAYNSLFFGDTQPVRLLQLRRLALDLMQEFEQFNPLLTGAVLNGTATEHSDIYLQLFCESPKDVVVYLINKNRQFEVSESRHFRKQGDAVETLSYMYRDEGVHLMVYPLDDLRGAVKVGTGGRPERVDIAGLKTLLGETQA
jgi:hypothetical protein